MSFKVGLKRLVTPSGRAIRKATFVDTPKGRIQFLDRVPKRQAIQQAKRQMKKGYFG